MEIDGNKDWGSTPGDGASQAVWHGGGDSRAETCSLKRKTGVSSSDAGASLGNPVNVHLSATAAVCELNDSCDDDEQVAMDAAVADRVKRGVGRGESSAWR